jgi:hypothetical protein
MLYITSREPNIEKKRNNKIKELKEDIKDLRQLRRDQLLIMEEMKYINKYKYNEAYDRSCELIRHIYFLCNQLKKYNED